MPPLAIPTSLHDTLMARPTGRERRTAIIAAAEIDPVHDVQVLCPMNRGGLGARSLNIELQNALNPPGEVRIERFGWTFCPGDKGHADRKRLR